jgi:lipoprotein-anchoring transpeptidase ErfK/SrfK
MTTRTAKPLRPAAVARLLLVALTLVTATQAGAASAHPTSAEAASTQQLAALLSAHEAYSAASLSSRRLGLVQATRPLTGEQTVLPVVGQAAGHTGHGWLDVNLPGRPNGHTGWIQQSGTRTEATPWRLVVDTATRQVSVYQNNRRVRTFIAIVGKPSTPTPRGHFFVEEAIQLPADAVGAPYALALSARSDALQTFDGGPGQIALHGLDNVGGTLGTAASHGCIRLADATMRWLITRIGPGVPVSIIR